MVGVREETLSETAIAQVTGMEGSFDDVPSRKFMRSSPNGMLCMASQEDTGNVGITNSSHTLQVANTTVTTEEYEARFREKEKNEMELMHARVWSSLPPELMERVLAWLPFQSLMKFRSVSKNWNRLLSSRSFMDRVHQVIAHQETWFLTGTVTENKLALYSPSLNKWQIRTLPTISMVNFDDVVVPEATMGGLVCLTKYSRQQEWTRTLSELFVWNPLTNDCRKLPETQRTLVWPCLTPCVAGMYVDFATKEYKLITVGNFCSAEELTSGSHNIAVVTEIYDSSTRSWKVGESLFPHRTVSRVTRWNICCGGSVYTVTRKPYTIIAFNMKTEVWREMAVPIVGVECPNLVELYNQLFMVAGLSGDETIRIWRIAEYEDGRVQWTEVDRMPPEFLEDLATSSREERPSLRHWRCVGNGDSLFFRYWASQKVLMYNITNQCWTWLPTCDLDYNRHYYAWNGLVSSPGWLSP